MAVFLTSWALYNVYASVRVERKSMKLARTFIAENSAKTCDTERLSGVLKTSL